MQVERFLEESAAHHPEKVALVCGGRRITYGELKRNSSRLAGLLRSRGVQRGDRVAILLDNSVEAVVGIFAVLKAGGVFMMVNSSTKADKLEFLLNDSRAAALVCDRRRSHLARAVWEQTPHLHTVLLTDCPASVFGDGTCGKSVVSIADEAAAPAPVESSHCIDIDLAALVYTSGSTGRPKAVMLTHLNIVSAATSITTYLENTASDVVLNVLPLSFDYGLYQVLMTFKVGATLILERSFTYPHAVLETLVRERCTGFPLVPTISAILLQRDLSAYDFRSLRYITNTGAALPTRHITELRRLLPHVKIYSMYGLTECKRVSYLPPEQIDYRPGSVGRGMPNEEVYIVDADGARLSSGVGELVIRGSNVMRGYWERPEETERVLRPGPLPGEHVLYSGDIFRMDDEGYLYFVARKDDIIKSRGEKVSPREVENVLYSCEGILDAAVVGVEDEILGEAVVAVVTLREGSALTPGDIQRFCAAHLEDYMVPTTVEIRSNLPKTSTGKISKTELKATVGV